MQKTIIAELDIQQALEGIECPRPHIEALRNEMLNGKLEDIINILLENKTCDSVISAIRFLLQSDKFSTNGQEKVHLGDIKKVSSNKRFYDQLDRLREKQKLGSLRDRSRIFGVKGHVAIPTLFSRILQETLTFLDDSSQLGFNFEDPHEPTLRDLLPEASKVVKVAQRKMSTNRRIKKIEELWKQVVDLLKVIRFPSHKRPYKLLVELLKPVYKKDLKEILDMGAKNPEDSYLAFITVMTWASVLIEHHKHKPRVLFKEIALMPHSYDVGFGRIDAIEVETINGMEPDEEQIKILHRLSLQDIKSVGHLIQKLERLFGDNISIIIHDWKFCAGDGDNGSSKSLNLIHLESILNRPLPKHQNQMHGYLSTSLISYGMVVDHLVQKLEDIWMKSRFKVTGRIHYFFPTSQPIVHDVMLSNEEKEEVFQKQIVQNYSDAEYRRETLNISRKWLKFTIGLVQGSVYKGRGSAKQVEFDFDAGNYHRGKISDIIKNSIKIKWYDELETVEYRGDDTEGNPLLFLHYDRFAEAIGKGLIRFANNFDLATGGHVSCYLPNHSHTGKGTPSLHISDKGFAKCYSCGDWIRILKNTIPDTFRVQMQTIEGKRAFKSMDEIQAFKVPERYQEAMKAAQRIFQNQFLDSPGAKYLERERKLDPALSMYLGAGYSDQRSIEYLLDQGFSYDELIEFGFIGLSHKVKESSTVVQMLKRRGMLLENISRLKPVTLEVGSIAMLPALPYIVLDKRLTYPLDINYVITHFYGRSVDGNCAKEYVHTKTSPTISIPQGGFNITKAMERALAKVKSKPGMVPEIGITEAPIDVDTVFQKGKDFREFGGLAGANNRLLFQILGCFPGNLITGLNWDESKIVKGVETLLAGQKNTIKLVKKMEGTKFPYLIYDFTEPFATKHPDFNDFNGYWQKVWKDYWEVLPVGSKTGSFKNYIEPFDFLYNRKRIFPKP